jgi:hypothetical protein
MELTMTTGGSPMAARMDDGVLVGSVSLPADGAPAEVVVTASASAVSTPSGIRLAPVAASATLATGIAPAPQAEAKATTVTPPGAQPPRWAFVSGLAVLALALPSAVLARRRWGSGRPPSAGGPAGGDGPGPEAPPGSPALAPAPELAPEPAPTTAPGPHRRGDVLASRGDALHELNRVSAKIPTPRGPADDPPRGASGDPVDRTAPDASWVPLADTSGPTLRAGWPFVEHGGERTDG